MKTCTKCSKAKELTEFYKSKRHKDGFYSICKDCCKKAAREAYKINPHRIKKNQETYFKNNPDAKRRIFIKYKYGITLEEYDLMYSNQKGRCAICNEKKSKLCIDHNHTTGEIRGLLCKQCNHAIGLLKEKITSLRSAISYLGGQYQDH